MNLQIVSWLIAHRDVLLKIVDAVKHFDPKSSHADKWAIIDQIARLIIPLIDENVKAASVEPDGDVQVYAAQVQDLGIDWNTFVNVILPIIMSILQMLVAPPKQ